MQNQATEQWIIKKNPDDLEQWINAFLVDRKAQSLSKTTLYFFNRSIFMW